MHHAPESKPDARGVRLAIAVSGYHPEVTEAMCRAAVDVFKKAGGNDAHLTIVPAAGSFELTAICRGLAHQEHGRERRAFDAIVAIGCILTGETAHDRYIAQSVTHGLTDITVRTGIPIGFGVLTCQSLEQARQRTSKGAEAAAAAILTVNALRRVSAKGDSV